MERLQSLTELTEWRLNHVLEHCNLAFVPTMGALHTGHLSLIDLARKHASKVVVSIFVNPTQFAAHEDFGDYPRTLDDDLAACERLGVDAVWIPRETDIYPEGVENVTKIMMPTELTQILCGVTRPHFFDGVATVVYRLFNALNPQIAVFGEKDFQQLSILKQMVETHDLGITLIGAPIIREPDGLALSSRNRYLSAAERVHATQLYTGLMAAQTLFASGERSVSVLTNTVRDACTDLKVDYCEIVDPITLRGKAHCDKTDRLCAAVYCGKTRLIDNLRLS